MSPFISVCDGCNVDDPSRQCIDCLLPDLETDFYGEVGERMKNIFSSACECYTKLGNPTVYWLYHACHCCRAFLRIFGDEQCCCFALVVHGVFSKIEESCEGLWHDDSCNILGHQGAPEFVYIFAEIAKTPPKIKPQKNNQISKTLYNALSFKTGILEYIKYL